MKRTAKPFTVEVKRARRKKQQSTVPVPAESDTSVAALIAAETLPVEPLRQGRILPSLEQPKPAYEPASAPDPEAAEPEPRQIERRAEPIEAAEAGDDAPASGADRLKARPTIIERPEHRRSTDKVPRQAFPRGERWKHRLPAAVHRSMRRPKVV